MTQTMKPGTIRMNYEGEPQGELFGEAVDVHIERMSARHWWIGVYRPDGSRVTANLHSEKKIVLNWAEETPP